MIKLVQKIPNWLEGLIVMFLGFGIFIYSSTLVFFTLINNSDQKFQFESTTTEYVSITVYESIALTVISLFLLVRKWKIKDFQFNFRLQSFLNAFLLVLCYFLVSTILFTLYNSLLLSLGKTIEPQVSIDSSSNLLGIVLILIINSIYEEVLLVGYLFKRLQNLHPVHIISISTLIRLSFHTYQGTQALLSIGALGVMFALFHWKFKNLSSLIIAHGLLNLITFLIFHFSK